jgi:hypothetical protein
MQALADFARKQEVLASEVASLAAKPERQGQPRIAAMLRQASHRYRTFSAWNRTLAMALDQGSMALRKPTFLSRVSQP